jgi:hypothetical protein
MSAHESARFDTCVPYEYLKIVGEIAAKQKDQNAILKRRPEIYRQMKWVLDSYFAGEEKLSSKYAHTLAAILAFESGDLAAARAHMQSINFERGQGEELGDPAEISRMLTTVFKL